MGMQISCNRDRKNRFHPYDVVDVVDVVEVNCPLGENESENLKGDKREDK